ncbi:MAG: methylmalonyl-CoA mutase family protein [Pseudomonadota bacterium]
MILSEESNLWRVQDPSAGSGTISALTEELCAAAWAHFQAIERGGGIVDALRTGDFQKQVAQSRAQLMADVASGATPMIGTSKYPVASIARPTTLDREARRYTRVARVGDNATRPNVREMTEHFASGGNRADVTARADIDVCAELPPIRLSEPFDDLRDRIRAASAARASSALDDNAAISVPVVCLGPAVDTNRIAGSISEFLATAGIGTDRHVIDPAHSGDAGRTLSGADATIAFVCAAPETIEEIGDASIQAVRGAGVSYVIAAQTIADPGALKAIDLTVDLSGDRLSQLEAIITQIESTLVN